jgi:hypothetical protein
VVRTQVSLTQAQYSALKASSEQTGSSLAELVRRAVDRWLEVSPSVSTREQMVGRALAVCGQFTSDVMNLSENHDRLAFDEE